MLIPVLLADLLFPRHRDRPYLRRSGLVIAGVAAVVGVVLLRVGIAAVEDPGYQTPLPVVLGVLVAVAALLFVALRILPGRTPVPPSAGRAPRPVLVALTAGAASACFLGLLMPPGLPPDRLADGPALGSGAWVFVPMALAAAVAACVGRLIHRWSGTAGWSDSYRIWLIGGALIGRTLFAVLTAPAATDYDWARAGAAIAVGTVMIAAMAFLLVRLDRRVRRRTAEGHGPTSAPARM